jgi:hypothetical protein
MKTTFSSKHRLVDMHKTYEHSFAKEIYAYYNTGGLSKLFPKDSPIRSFRELY